MSIYRVAQCHYDGVGVVQDWPLAYSWASVASTMGVAEAKKLRDYLATQLSSEAREKATAEAKRMYSEFEERIKDKQELDRQKSNK